jgi:hypothetical protein
MTKARNIAELANDISVDSNRDVTLSNLRSDQPMTFRNRIINGNFDIWQRGESQQSSGYGSADRWSLQHSGSTKTASQQAFTAGQTEVPGNPKYYLHHEVSSVAGTGNYCAPIQRIEGVETLAGQTATISFWAKADANKNIATEISQRFGTGGSPSAGVDGIGVTTHALTTSWQKFTATVSIPSISGKTIGSDGNDRFDLLFWFEAGSDFNSRTNSLGQPNNGTTYEVDIAQVQVEEGSVPTPFEHRPYGTELALCQRYFQRFESTNTDAAIGFGMTTSATRAIIYVPWKVTMRAAPTISASNLKVSDWQSVSIAVGNPAAQYSNETSASIDFSVSGFATYRPCYLLTNTSAGYLDAYAEL